MFISCFHSDDPKIFFFLSVKIVHFTDWFSNVITGLYSGIISFYHVYLLDVCLDLACKLFVKDFLYRLMLDISL